MSSGRGLRRAALRWALAGVGRSRPTRTEVRLCGPQRQVGDQAHVGRCPAFSRRPGLRRHLEGRRSEEHTSELQSHVNLVCRLLLEKKKKKKKKIRKQQQKKKKKKKTKKKITN